MLATISGELKYFPARSSTPSRKSHQALPAGAMISLHCGEILFLFEVFKSAAHIRPWFYVTVLRKHA